MSVLFSVNNDKQLLFRLKSIIVFMKFLALAFYDKELMISMCYKSSKACKVSTAMTWLTLVCLHILLLLATATVVVPTGFGSSVNVWARTAAACWSNRPQPDDDEDDDEGVLVMNTQRSLYDLNYLPCGDESMCDDDDTLSSAA